MKISIKNNAQLPNKIARFIKWKVYSLSKKFKHLLYVEVHLKAEGQQPKMYIVNLRLGIPGNDIILNNQSTKLKELLNTTTKSAHRYLNKTKYRKMNKKLA